MPHVVKLGGSLLDLSDLPRRIERWRPTGDDILMVVGGGRAADLVRQFDRRFHLGETRGHWLAVRAMRFNAHLVAAILPDARIVTDQAQAQAAWSANQLAIVDPLDWLERQERDEGIAVPHRWSFTSDSIAAHLATTLKADKLTLLKSTLTTGGEGIDTLVDDDFAEAAAHLPCIEIVNLRSLTLERRNWRSHA